MVKVLAIGGYFGHEKSVCDQWVSELNGKHGSMFELEPATAAYNQMDSFFKRLLGTIAMSGRKPQLSASFCSMHESLNSFINYEELISIKSSVGW